LDSDALIIINPSKPFSDTEIEHFYDYIKKGGKALILDDPRHINISTSYQILRPIGLNMEFYEIKKGKIVNEREEEIWDGEHLGIVEGGNPILFIKEDLNKKKIKSKKEMQKNYEEYKDFPILTCKRHENGIVVLFGCSYIFTNNIMGSTSTVPDEKLRKIFDLEFRILEEFLGFRDQKGGEM